jgi:glycosyltransferase involved in cell wall biosynthesis
MPLSILFVTAMYPHAEQPGSGAFVMHQVQSLRALGHEVNVVHVRGYQSRWNYLQGAFRVLRATWHTRYDVVHVHYGLTGVCALIRWRTPLVITLHGSDVLQGRLQPFVSRLVSRMADATIVVSPELAAPCPGTIIPCGVDLEKFRRMDQMHARQQLGLPVSGKLVLFPFDPQRRVKRYDLAHGAVQLLRARGLDVTILSVWTVANEQMPLYYSAADVMVLCSDTEGSPTSVKEALACDLPVVSTDVGDVRSVITGIDGTETCAQDLAALAAGLERVLERNAKVAFDGRSAMARFDQVRTAQALVDVYRTVRRKTPRLAASSNYN